ncbi:hypothetical protein HDZ31DRAFT_69672, partial [Schizophyllum fasciatum]
LNGSAPNPFPSGRKPTYDDVLRECGEIRDAHERRVERGRLVVAQILEKTDRYEWKERVAVEEEEPEELGFDPRYALNAAASAPADGPLGEEGEFGDDDSSSDDEGEGIPGETDAVMEDAEVPDESSMPIDPALQAMWQG